ncbi:MAG: ABC transporter permease [Chloroflexi bacterium]|nr:ABC transporter permease [Chloroflexota bacterium]
MTVAREIYYIYLRNMRTWIGQPMAVASTVMSSAFIFLFFGAPLERVTQLPGFPSGDYEAFLVGMVLVMTVVFSGADMAMAMLTDILSGYFDKLLLAPINRFSILMGSLLTAGTRALAQVLIIVGIAAALGVNFRGGTLGIIAVVLASTVFGVAWACVGLIIALKTKSAQVTQSTWLLFMPIVFLTSAFMPREYLSGWFKIAATVNPVEYVLRGMRVIVIQGWEWETILPGLWVLVAMTVALTTVATWLYHRVTA